MIVVKIYRDSFSSREFGYAVGEELQENLDMLREYVNNQLDRDFYFTTVRHIKDIVLNVDCFAEIEHTGELSDEEKEELAERVRVFFIDGKGVAGYPDESTGDITEYEVDSYDEIEVMVKFKRISDDDIYIV
ncbi:MAG: hypothetical protein J6B34_03245 [Clostridia bacterium]|nr:hypothetical protein [Clostridia bacterium]